MAFTDSAEWKMGDSSQKDYAMLIAKRGFVVMPVYDMNDAIQATKAPVLFSDTGLLVAPDVLLMSAKSQVWQDVKAKSKPTWRRIEARWEHGCDYALAVEYQKVQKMTGIPAGIVVHESKSPLDETMESYICGPPAWLYITINDAFKLGTHRTDWPGGKDDPSRRGKKGMGGLLWARSEMKTIKLT